MSPPRPISRDDLLTLAEATRELGFRRSEAESWLRSEGLVVSVCGRERVVWGSVLDAITGAVQEPPRRGLTVPIPVDEGLLRSWAGAPRGSGSRPPR